MSGVGQGDLRIHKAPPPSGNQSDGVVAQICVLVTKKERWRTHGQMAAGLLSVPAAICRRPRLQLYDVGARSEAPAEQEVDFGLA